jgi:hypothetical protein
VVAVHSYNPASSAVVGEDMVNSASLHTVGVEENRMTGMSG